MTGGSLEYLTKSILKAGKGDPAQAQWIAMIVGASISKATGGNEQLGAFIAVNAVRNNLLWEQITEFRESLKDEDLSDLEPWQCRIVGFNFGKGISYNEMAILFNNEGIDVFSSASASLGLGVYPMDGMVGVGHVEDPNGNIVTDPAIINKQMAGWSYGASVSVLGGVAKFQNPCGYSLVLKFMQTNISGSISIGYTMNLGRLKNL